MNALNPGDDFDHSGFIDGADCNCPNDCDETIYFQEMSQAALKYVIKKDTPLFTSQGQLNIERECFPIQYYSIQCSTVIYNLTNITQY